MSGTVRLLITLVACLALTTEAYAHVVITRMSDSRNVNFPQMLTEMERSDLILMGEAHNDKNHHEMQLALIRSLSDRGTPLAIGLEMMQADSQQRLDDWTEGRMNEESFRAVFAENWSEDWPMYRDIFIFARDNHIPMVAINVPKAIVRKVSNQGFASLTPEEKKDLPQGTSCDLNNPYTELLKRSFRDVFVHAMNRKIFIHFCEAQTLRNSGMAMNIARYAKRHPGTKIVVLTGIWHAVKSAIPEQLKRNGSKLVSTVVLPELPGSGTESAAASEADFTIGL